MARSSTSISKVGQELRGLKNRVAWLERALKSAKKPISLDLDLARDNAEAQARSDALREYYQRLKAEIYQRDPDWLKRDRAEERKVNAFLRSRGIKPGPSMMPADMRRKKD